MNDPILKLIELRKEAEELVRKRLSDSSVNALSLQNQELQESQDAIQGLYTKLQQQEGAHQLEVSELNQRITEADIRMKKSDKEKESLEELNYALTTELENYKQSLSDRISERENLTKQHLRDIADLKLKHEQEIYILKKIKR